MRRGVMAILGAMLLAPQALLAQSRQNPVTIGWLHFSSRDESAAQFAAFKEGLAALGWKEGQQYVIEARWADGRRERLPALAAEIATKRPALIVGAPSPAVAAVAKAAPATPVVQANGGDPVATGLAASLARPGGMITGLSNSIGETQQKFVELLVAAAPKVRRIGILIDSTTSSRPRSHELAQLSATQFSVEVRVEEAARPEDIEPAMARLAKQGAQALITYTSPLFTAEGKRIVRLALAQRWPVVGPPGIVQVDAGALLSYGVDSRANFRRAAYYVDRILKGAKPGELPFEQPTTFELAVNLKTAKALGITIPQAILVRADRVIE